MNDVRIKFPRLVQLFPISYQNILACVSLKTSTFVIWKLYKLFLFTNQNQRNGAQIIDQQLYYRRSIWCLKNFFIILYPYMRQMSDYLQASMHLEKGHRPHKVSTKSTTTSII